MGLLHPVSQIKVCEALRDCLSEAKSSSLETGF